jgi:hypothetical protein
MMIKPPLMMRMPMPILTTMMKQPETYDAHRTNRSRMSSSVVVHEQILERYIHTIFKLAPTLLNKKSGLTGKAPEVGTCSYVAFV